MAPTFKDGDWLLVSWLDGGLAPLVGDRILGKVVVMLNGKSDQESS
jgi:hypothetical protein